MSKRYDLVVVGMGSGGIVAAELAARIGWRVAAVERDRIGGDCLWTGCVPSKALLAAARVAHTMRTAERFGIPASAPTIDGARVWKRIHRVQAEIAATDDSPERFEALGVEVVHGSARLVGRNELDVDGRRLRTRFVLLATGSRPAVPSIEGLADAGFQTSETIFELDRLPESVVVIGGGPVGVELAQALVRLGSAVTVLQRADRLLRRDEPELAARLTRVLEREGVEVRVGADVVRVKRERAEKAAHARIGGSERRFEAQEILVAAGRVPNIEGLDLEAAGVRARPSGVHVDRRLRTSARSVYAAGDVAGRFVFTHSAAYEAAVAVRNMAFPGWARAPALVPWCTFTDPELAHTGMTGSEARARYGERRVRVRTLELTRSDRARTDGATDGMLVVVEAKGRVVGAQLLSPSAGEAIHELGQLVRRGGRLADAGRFVHVYPTISTSINALAAQSAFERAERLSFLTRLPRRPRVRAARRAKV